MEVIKISIFLLSGFYAFYKISPATNSDEHVSIPVVFVLNKKKIKITTFPGLITHYACSQDFTSILAYRCYQIDISVSY